MKKFLSGMIAGLFLFAGATVFADSSSLIGQKVQGLFVIEKSGVKVSDAVVINGTAYAPVRAVSEATGVTLQVEGKKIIMGNDNNNSATPNNGETPTKKTASQYQKEFQISILESEIESAEGAIKGLEESREDINKYPLEQQRIDAKAKLDSKIQEKQNVIEEKTMELEALKKQPAEAQ